MGFEFTYGGHGDITLTSNGQIHNLGYNYIPELPIMMWLTHKQCGSRNLFSAIDLPNFQSEYHSDEELEDLLEITVSLAQRLPLPIKEFNIETAIDRLSGFSNGAHSITYTFEMGGNKTLYLKRNSRDKPSEEIILTLTLTNSASLTQKYLRFISQKEMLEKYAGQMKRTISALSRL